VKAVDLGIFAITSFSERCIFFWLSRIYPVPSFLTGEYPEYQFLIPDIYVEASPYDFNTFPQNTMQIRPMCLLSKWEQWCFLSQTVYNIDELAHNKIKFKSVYKPFLKSTSYNSVNTALPLESSNRDL
jgi:hypothetical protein